MECRIFIPLQLENRSDGHGRNIVDVESMIWGFRHLRVLAGAQGGMLTLNGQSVKMKGVNQADFYVSDSQLLPSLKQLNVDTIYCLADSLNDEFLLMADRIGVYLLLRFRMNVLEM